MKLAKVHRCSAIALALVCGGAYGAVLGDMNGRPIIGACCGVAIGVALALAAMFRKIGPTTIAVTNVAAASCILGPACDLVDPLLPVYGAISGAIIGMFGWTATVAVSCGLIASVLAIPFRGPTELACTLSGLILGASYCGFVRLSISHNEE